MKDLKVSSSQNLSHNLPSRIHLCLERFLYICEGTRENFESDKHIGNEAKKILSACYNLQFFTFCTEEKLKKSLANGLHLLVN